MGRGGGGVMRDGEGWGRSDERRGGEGWGRRDGEGWGRSDERQGGVAGGVMRDGRGGVGEE